MLLACVLAGEDVPALIVWAWFVSLGALLLLCSLAAPNLCLLGGML